VAVKKELPAELVERAGLEVGTATQPAAETSPADARER